MGPKMSRIRYGVVILVTLSIFGLAGQARAAIPQTLNFQGYLTNTAGTPITGTVAMIISIYAQESGGTALWTETHPDVALLSGVYNVLLGDITPLGLPFDGPYYLGIQVGTDSEMTPRLSLSSVGYAIRAGVAEQALIQGFPLSPGVPSANQVLKFNGTNWVPSPVSLENDVSGVLPVSRGGTGSGTQNFVDLSTNQTVGGIKTFSNPIASNLPTGTAPLQVTSTTTVNNLSAEMVDGKKLIDLDNRYGVVTAPSRASRTNTINSLSDLAGYHSIAIGIDGFPVISYSGLPGAGLRVAKCQDAACTSTAVTFNTLDSSGRDSSIAIGADGFPVISYRDADDHLKLVKCGDLTCSPAAAVFQSLDSTYWSGWETSLAVGADNFPIVSYIVSWFPKTLKVAKCGDLSCTPSSVSFQALDTYADYCDMTMGVDRFPVISYYEGLNKRLKVAKCGDESCASFSTQILDSGITITGTSIAIGTDGFPVVTYHDATNNFLRMVKCGDRACTPGLSTLRILDSSGDAGAGASLAIGVDGLPVVSYSRFSTSELKLAKCGDSSCSPSLVTLGTLDSTGFGGVGTSMAIGTDGSPVIAIVGYAGQFRVVKCANPYCLNNWWRR